MSERQKAARVGQPFVMPVISQLIEVYYSVNRSIANDAIAPVAQHSV